MRSSGNKVFYVDCTDHSFLFEALELADEAIETECENYHFIYRAAAWAIENATADQLASFDPTNDVREEWSR